MISKRVATGISMLLFLATLVACGGGGGGGGGDAGGGGGGGNPGGVVLQSIAVAPANSNLGVGASQGFVATGSYSDGTTRNITDSVAWSSNVPAVASVSAAGLAGALTLGSTQISAASGSVTGATMLNVVNKTVQSIAVTPEFVSINTAATVQLLATATYSDGTTQDITSSVTWASANTAIASVSTAGLVTGVAAQNGNAITATLGLAVGRSRVSVTPSTASLTGLVLAPQNMFVRPNFQAFPYPDALYSNGTGSTNYSFVSWTSSNPAVAIVDPNQGIKAIAQGVTTLTVKSGSITASNTLTVTNPVLDSIIVLPIIPTIAQGAVLQMTATGFYSDGTQKDITTLAGLIWSSGNAAVVAVNATGIASGVSAGSTLITATAGIRSASTTASVPATAPQTFTVALAPLNDNTIFKSSLNADAASSVYQTNAWYPTPGIGVGCAWYYSPEIGFAPAHMDASCSQGLLKFDLSSLAGKTIQSATLRLRTAAYGVGYVPRQWSIQAAASPWSGSTVTWNNFGGLYYVYSQTVHNPPTFVGQIFDLDQTTTVRNWVGGVYQNHGFSMGLTNVVYPMIYNVSLDAFEFHSGEDAGGRGPQLIVTYQ